MAQLVVFEDDARRGLPRAYEASSEELERAFLTQAMTRAGGDTARAAEETGVPGRTLEERLKDRGIRVS